MRILVGGAAVLGALAVASSLVACGGSDGSGAGGQSASASTAAGPGGAGGSASAAVGGASSSTAAIASSSSGAGCGDLMNDPANCGACAHDCLGGACVVGLCQPVALREVPNLNVMDLDDTSIYWGGDDGTVFKGPKQPGAEAPLAMMGTSVLALKVRKGKVWVTANGLQTIDPQSGAITDVVMGGPSADGAFDDLYGYVSESYSVRKVPLDGSAPIELPADMKNNPLGFYNLNDLFTDGTTLYLTGTGYSGQGPAVFVVPKNGGAPYIWEDKWRPAKLAFTKTLAVGVESDGVTTYVDAVSKNGGKVKSIGTSPGSVSGFVVDEKAAYWTTDKGDVYSVPLGGGVAKKLFTGAKGVAHYLVEDDQALYFKDGDWKLQKLAK